MNAASPDLIQKYLACAHCKGSLALEKIGYVCTACRRAFETKDDVFLAKPLGENHYFDNKHEVMQEGNASPETWTLFYAQQSRAASELIRQGDVVVDIGCGPSIHFDKPSAALLIGIDPSFASIRANKDLDVRVFGGAEVMPLGEKSADRIFMFYSIHHMVGKTVCDNTKNLRAVMRECSRVIRSDGNVVIFDMNPWWPAWTAQRFLWNQARSVLADKLDMFFWRGNALQDLTRECFSGARLETRVFSSSPFLVFPPVFSLPKLKIPRFLYPFDVMMYKWSF